MTEQERINELERLYGADFKPLLPSAVRKALDDQREDGGEWVQWGAYLAVKYRCDELECELRHIRQIASIWDTVVTILAFLVGLFVYWWLR